jgi:hypothetical protein
MQEVVIVSLNNLDLIDQLDCKYSQGRGVYKGIEEVCLILKLKDFEKHRNIFKEDGQELYLYLDSKRNATLKYFSSDKEHALGLFKPCTKAVAFHVGNYTFLPKPMGGTYYTTTFQIDD